MFKGGIEIHFDEKRGHLRLGCESDAFSAYREIVRGHLEDFPEIQIEKIVELEIVDSETFVARRDAPKRRLWDILFGVFIVVILSLAAVGAYVLIAKKIV